MRTRSSLTPSKARSTSCCISFARVRSTSTTFPIVLITEQYLGYLGLMQEMNLDVAGEFLVMAATLIHIKSRTLLPRPRPVAGRAGAGRGSRAKRSSGVCSSTRDTRRQRNCWTNGRRCGRAVRPSRCERRRSRRRPVRAGVRGRSLRSAGGFRSVLERASRRPPMVLPPDQISIEDRIHQLLGRLSETEACDSRTCLLMATARAPS